MRLDKHGLPVQADGDANDQLQRVGMIATAEQLTKSHSDLGWDCLCVLATTLQPRPGIFIRHISANPNNVSADQLISVLCYWIASRNVKQAAWMFLRMLCRFGFAQNYKDGLNEDTKTKLPDFMALRALPIFVRISKWFYPLAVMSDLLLVLSAIASVGPVWRDDKGFTKRSPDDVDDNLIIQTLAVCRAVMPTPLSWLAARLYAKFRPWNYGCPDLAFLEVDGSMNWKLPSDTHSPVYGALRWYHRAESGGNPEIAELWRPIVERYLTSN